MAVRPVGGRGVPRDRALHSDPHGGKVGADRLRRQGVRRPPVFAGVSATFDIVDAWTGSGTLSGTPSRHTVM